MYIYYTRALHVFHWAHVCTCMIRYFLRMYLVSGYITQIYRFNPVLQYQCQLVLTMRSLRWYIVLTFIMHQVVYTMYWASHLYLFITVTSTTSTFGSANALWRGNNNNIVSVCQSQVEHSLDAPGYSIEPATYICLLLPLLLVQLMACWEEITFTTVYQKLHIRRIM